jgi:hypothetical protein
VFVLHAAAGQGRRSPKPYRYEARRIGPKCRLNQLPVSGALPSGGNGENGRKAERALLAGNGTSGVRPKAELPKLLNMATKPCLRGGFVLTGSRKCSEGAPEGVGIASG